MVGKSRGKGHDQVLDSWSLIRSAQRSRSSSLWATPRSGAASRPSGAVARRNCLDVSRSDRHEALLDRYRRARVFLLPSTQEGFGLVYVEAMHGGRRAWGARRSGGTIDHTRTGLIVRPRT